MSNSVGVSQAAGNSNSRFISIVHSPSYVSTWHRKTKRGLRRFGEEVSINQTVGDERSIFKMAHQGLWNSYIDIPIVTRAYTTACVLTTLAVHMELVSPYDLYFNPYLVFRHYQIWRILTTFLFFGTLSFNFVFNIIFTYRYCRTLEESSFRGRTADFVLMFVFGAGSTLIIAYFANLIFLGHAFTLMLVYVWSRRNPMVRMNFFGILNFQAPLLPLVILGFSLLLGNPVQIDLIGISVGHLYYFLEDVFPNQPGGFRMLKTPQFLRNLFDPMEEDPSYNPLPEDRPGGFDWGGAAAQGPVENPDQGGDNPNVVPANNAQDNGANEAGPGGDAGVRARTGDRVRAAGGAAAGRDD